MQARKSRKDGIETSIGSSRQILICDTTLRDGEQAPGFSMSVGDKLKIAHALGQLKVDVIEAGFAASSRVESDSIRQISRDVKGPVISSLARAHERDIDEALRALEPAARRRLHLFIGTSPIHRTAKLKLSKSQILERIGRCVRHAASSGAQVQFSAEDATRTEMPFLVEAFQTAADAGACILNVPDTVGYALPGEVERLFSRLGKQVKTSGKAVFSAHCHNDLGLAVANSLAAVRGGAGQIECTINGIGERAGNCALEEVVMAFKVREKAFAATTLIATQRLFETSQLVAQACRNAVPPNKAIVGANAFAHEAGIHQHGILSDRSTYEIMDPAEVGQVSKLVLGRHSGKHALAATAKRLGVRYSDDQLDAAFARLKSETDKLAIVSDEEVCELFASAPVSIARSGAETVR